MHIIILQDVSVQSKDFVGSLPGIGQHFKCMDSRHGKLVMPESMVTSEAVDAAQRHEQKGTIPNQGTSVDAHARAHEHAHAQRRNVQQAAEHREDEYLKGALKTTDFDREQQVRLLREIEKAHQEKKQNASDNQQYVDHNKRQDHYSVFPGPADSSSQAPYQQQPSRPPGPNEPSTGTSSVRGRVHAYESPDRTRRNLQKMRDQHSISDDHLLGHHSGRGGANNVQLHHQRSMPGPGAADKHLDLQQVSNSAHQPHAYVQQNDHSNQPLYNNIPGSGGGPQQQFRPLEEWHPDKKPALDHSDNQAFYQRGQQFRQGAQDFPPQGQMHQQQQQDVQQQGMQGGQQLQQQLLQQYEPPPTQPPYDGTHPNIGHLPHGAGAVAPQETVLRSFSMGSIVQLQSDPPRYGVILWIGTLPGILEGRIAGVELVS